MPFIMQLAGVISKAADSKQIPKSVNASQLLKDALKKEGLSCTQVKLVPADFLQAPTEPIFPERTPPGRVAEKKPSKGTTGAVAGFFRKTKEIGSWVYKKSVGDTQSLKEFLISEHFLERYSAVMTFSGVKKGDGLKVADAAIKELNRYWKTHPGTYQGKIPPFKFEFCGFEPFPNRTARLIEYDREVLYKVSSFMVSQNVDTPGKVTLCFSVEIVIEPIKALTTKK